jgi:hypothetical protein
MASDIDFGAATYNRNFTFDQGTLGLNLAKIDEDIHDYIVQDVQTMAVRGAVVMKSHAPWRDRTTDARNGLFCDPWWDEAGRYSIIMGHTVDYGIYLEEYHGGRFQIVMPTLIAISKAMMLSLEGMLNNLDTPGAATAAAVTAPAVGLGRGTSQGALDHGQAVRGAVEHHQGAPKRSKIYFRNAKGQFVKYKSIMEDLTKTTTKTKTTKKTSTKTTKAKTTTTKKKRKQTPQKGMVFPVTVTYKKPGK